MTPGINLQGWFFLILAWGAIIILTVYCMRRVLFGKKAHFDEHIGKREHWGTRIGLILAVAGNAIGLGNFLRFPVKAAANGGGAFMIPYFCALLFLGIPMMWVEWTIGRKGGVHGHGTTPGMFDILWKHPVSKYLGSLGIALPFIIGCFYVYVESWTLAFSFFSGTGKYFGNTTREAMGQFLKGYQGVESNQFFGTVVLAVIFLAITIALNFYFVYKGISKGIELLAKYGMPLLFIFAIILVVRTLTLGTPDPVNHPDWSITNGMAYIWNPDFSALSQAKVWLAAAGQIFFTLSLGYGIINTYASYLTEKDDVTLNGLATSSVNEFAEVVLGGTIAIPIAIAFFGLAETQVIAQQGAFDLGFQSLPVIFQKIPVGQLFGAMWFLLLFIAGITSSVAMMTPAVAFLMDEFKWTRRKAAIVSFSVLVLGAAFVVAFFKFGVLDELDFWAGTLGLVFFAALEIIVFSWIYGIRRGWEDMHKGADLKVSKVFKFILTWVTPIYMLVILGMWIKQDAIKLFLMVDVPAERHPYLWGARALFIGVIAAVNVLVWWAWKRKKRHGAHEKHPA
jgi:SNF family Na+-dependent transporter